MSALLFRLDGGEPFVRALAAAGLGTPAEVEIRRFPDGESGVRVAVDVRGRDAIVVAPLFPPDERLVPLLLLAATLDDLGAARVGLVAPYLAYLRQDARFREGEGITSRYVARLLSGSFDWLATIDPHLHRFASLGEIYSIPTQVIPAAPAIAAWVRARVPRPLLVGPDGESEPWVARVAAEVGAPFAVARKERRGDRDVTVTLPDLAAHRDRVPVVVDDIASTARTQVAVVSQLRAAGFAPPVCVAVHALFVGDAHAALVAAGAGAIVTCNTVPHPTNAIDMAPALAAALAAPGSVAR